MRRRLRLPLGVLLAIALAGLLSACGGRSAPEAPGSLGSLASVADASRSASTGRFSFSLNTGFGGQTLALTGEGAYDDVAKRAAVKLDLSALAQSLSGLGQALGGTSVGSGFDDPESWKLEAIQDNGTMYLRFPLLAPKLPAGAEWVKVDLAAIVSRAGSGLGQFGSLGSTDPRGALDALKAIAGPLEVVAREDVRGTSTTHYRASLDPAQIASKLGADGSSADVVSGFQQMLGQLGLQSVPLDVWVDDEGLLRRFSLDLTATPQGATGEVRVAMTFELFDYGEDVGIDLPSPERVADAAALGLLP